MPISSAGDGGGRASSRMNSFVLRDPLPVAEVLDEAAGIVRRGWRRAPARWARPGCVRCRARPAPPRRGVKAPPHSDGAVAAEVLDQVRGQHRPSLRSQRGSTQNRPCRRFRHSRPIRRPSSSITPGARCPALETLEACPCWRAGRWWAGGRRRSRGPGHRRRRTRAAVAGELGTSRRPSSEERADLHARVLEHPPRVRRPLRPRRGSLAG